LHHSETGRWLAKVANPLFGGRRACVVVDTEDVELAAEVADPDTEDEAVARDVDLIVMGSSARWRRQSRFFSPTVDFVLRRAPCEVLVVAFPDGTFEE